MKKLTLLPVLLLSAALIFSGCGSSSSAASSSSGSASGSEAADASSGAASGSDTEAGDDTEESGGIVSPFNITDTEKDSETGSDADENTAESSDGIHHAEITVKDYGTISVELDGDAAPITVANFIKLADEGFYDGLTFHRIISGFMIQGGDPNGNGTGGSDENIKGEFSANGVENDLSHTRGAISMARSQNYDSASSQFFIVHEDSTYLDGQYAVFGYVTDGMDVVDQICEDTPVQDNNGTVAAEDQPVIESIRILD